MRIRRSCAGLSASLVAGSSLLSCPCDLGATRAHGRRGVITLPALSCRCGWSVRRALSGGIVWVVSHRKRGAERGPVGAALDCEGAAERLDPVAEPHEARTATGVGAADPVVAHRQPQPF